MAVQAGAGGHILLTQAARNTQVPNDPADLDIVCHGKMVAFGPSLPLIRSHRGFVAWPAYDPWNSAADDAFEVPR